MKLTQSPPSPMSKFAVDRPMVALLAVWLACNIFTPVKDAHIENPNCHLLTTSPSLRGAEGPPELRSRSSASLIALPGPPRADPASCLQITKKFRYRCFKLAIRHSVTSFSQMWGGNSELIALINCIITQLRPMQWKWVCQNHGRYI